MTFPKMGESSGEGVPRSVEPAVEILGARVLVRLTLLALATRDRARVVRVRGGVATVVVRLGSGVRRLVLLRGTAGLALAEALLRVGRLGSVLGRRASVALRLAVLLPVLAVLLLQGVKVRGILRLVVAGTGAGASVASDVEKVRI